MHDPTNHLTRREAAAALAALGLVGPIAGDEEKPKSPVEITGDALFGIIQARFAKNLTAEQLQRIRAGIQGGLLSGEALRRRRLTPADEPAFVFSPEVP